MADADPLSRCAPINLAEEPAFELGGLQVRPSELRVEMDGTSHQLQPRIMCVLVALVGAKAAVVSRDRLIEQCWDGRIVGDDALNRCILALRHLAQQFSPQPFDIQTVARVGHRLVENGKSYKPATKQLEARRWPLFLAAAALLLSVAAGIFIWQRPSAAGASPASIAVMPFRNLGDGDSYFAEGIGEEILGQLAREPQFRVAGSSSSSNAAANANVQDAAKALGVDYALEGTIRRQGDQVRVNADLIRASDGIHVWSDSYDGSLDDIFAIQRSIGTAIAGALKRKLVRAPALSGPLITDGNAYDLYLTARGLIRTRNRRAGPIAADLLRDAIQIDAGYAPAWSSLGEATLLAGALKDQESFVASASEAQGYARHALELAPDLAEAHRALGGLLGFGNPEAVSHLRRAAELEPSNADNLIGLGIAQGAAGEFDQEIAAYQRALEIDPLSFRAAGYYAAAAAEMGDRNMAAAAVRRGQPGNAIQQQILLAKVDLVSGDFSEAYRRWLAVAQSNSPRWSDTARHHSIEAALAVGLHTGPIISVPQPLDQRHYSRVWMDLAPVPAAWTARNRNEIAAAVYRDDNHVAAKLMLARGRWPELAAAYDSNGGLVGIQRGRRLRFDQLSEVPVVILTLRRAGRSEEAQQLLTQAVKLTEAAYRQSRVPFWFDADAAALSAVQSRKDEAFVRLDRALERGWSHSGSSDLPDFADEPAFRLLRGDPRFDRARARLAEHYARERRETGRIIALMRG